MFALVEPQRQRYELRSADGELVAVHVRIDDAKGKTFRWVTPDGRLGLGGRSTADLPLYGVHLDLVQRSRTVVVVEGEKAATALLDAGIAAVGTVTGASSTPSQRALADLAGKAVVLWPDADEVGAGHMIRIAKELRGIAASVAWVTWPDAGPGADAYDCIRDHGVARALDLIRSAGPIPDSAEMTFSRSGLGYRATWVVGKVEMTLDRIRVRSGAVHGELRVRSDHPAAPSDGHLLIGEFNVSAMTSRTALAKELSQVAPKIDVDWRAYLEAFCRRVLLAQREGAPITTIGGQRPARSIQPWLLYPLLARDPVIVYGEGGSGKSFFAAGVAVSVAAGVEVIPSLQPVSPGRVLILDWEADEDTWHDRIVAVAAGLGIDPPEIDYRACSYPLTDQVEDVSRYVADNGIALLIVDSVGMASPHRREGGDANESAVRLFAALRQIGTTALLIDHVSKAQAKEAAADPYGSVYKTNLARATWELRRENEEEAPVVNVVLFNRKTNYGPRRHPISYTMTFEEGAVRFAPLPRDDWGESLERSLRAVDRVLRALRHGPQRPADLATELGIPPATVRVILHRAVSKGQVVKLGNGQFAIAERGGF